VGLDVIFHVGNGREQVYLPWAATSATKARQTQSDMPAVKRYAPGGTAEPMSAVLASDHHFHMVLVALGIQRQHVSLRRPAINFDAPGVATPAIAVFDLVTANGRQRLCLSGLSG
jgi:pyridoxal biosynthesis lyase PdxS